MLRGRAVRLIALVADYGPGDLRYALMVQRLALAAPEASVCPTVVAHGDSLAAGLCVAALASGEGVVVHDIAGPADELWIGRSRSGTLIVGADGGWAWSFVAPVLSELYRMDVHSLDHAVRRAVTAHPHAVCGVVDRGLVPVPPECVVVWTDRDGGLQTSLKVAPADRVVARIGDCSSSALFTPGAFGRQRLTVDGASAAERFGSPAAGTRVELAAARTAPALAPAPDRSSP